MELKRSDYLFMEMTGTDFLLLHAYLHNRHIKLSNTALPLLQSAENWSTVDQLVGNCSSLKRDVVLSLISQLIEERMLIVRESTEELLEERMQDVWHWGKFTAAYHHLMRHTEHIDDEAGEEWLRARTADRPSPPLFEDNASNAFALPKINSDGGHKGVSRTMLARESRRDFLELAVPLAALSDCLYAANGLREEVEIDIYGRLPLTMTPSGGARNPYELYVLALRVTGLEPGIYHYAAKQHSLELRAAVPDGEQYRWLMGKQTWPVESAATVLMVAQFPRTMWKYAHGQAYKAVLIEAGAIMQNLLLAATAHKLAASPSGAIHIKAWEELLELDPATQAPLMSVSLGIADPDAPPVGTSVWP